jgi:GTP-binding protein
MMGAMKLLSVEYIKGTPRWEDGPRDGLPEIAVIGRSNVGKSSLINLLLGRRVAYVSGTPGKTQLIHFYKINQTFYLVDLPGYGYANAPKETRLTWGPMIESYLLKRSALCALIFLIDIRHPAMAPDLQMKEWIDHYQVTPLFVATKGDKIPRGRRKSQEEAIKKNFGISNLIVTSAEKKEGREALWKGIEAVLSEKPRRTERPNPPDPKT